MAKLIYIASMGHSGSTMLDLMCGSAPNVFSMGEVQFLSWQLLQGEIADDPQTFCSCGVGFENCGFWGKIFRKTSTKVGIDLFKDPALHDFSLNQNIKRYERNNVRYFFNKVITLAYRYPVFRPLFNLSYQFFLPSVKRNWEMFDLVSEESGCEFVVDSSKDMNRYLLLKKYRPQDVKLIILIRDVKGVASSSHEGLDHDIIMERAHQWVKYYAKKMEATIEDISTDEYTIIRYDQLCQNPDNELSRVWKMLGSEKRNPDLSVTSISPYKHHTLQGNPMRLSKKDLKIRYDERWRERLTEQEVVDLNGFVERIPIKYRK